MTKKLKYLFLTLGILLGVTATILVPVATTSAKTAFDAACNNKRTNDSTVCANKDGDKIADFVRKIINVLVYLSGSIAVIMIIVGGIRYMTSNGDASKTASAKNTILYSVVGLVVVVMAYAIVAFVLDNL